MRDAAQRDDSVANESIAHHVTEGAVGAGRVDQTDVAIVAADVERDL